MDVLWSHYTFSSNVFYLKFCLFFLFFPVLCSVSLTSFTMVFLKQLTYLILLQGLVKLADFGVATKLTEADVNTHSVVGTPYWMAPEVLISYLLSQPHVFPICSHILCATSWLERMIHMMQLSICWRACSCETCLFVRLLKCQGFVLLLTSGVLAAL